MADLPFGLGLLDNAQPLRLHRLGEHQEEYGFPEGHPAAESLLSMPVRIGDTVFGNLYLSQKADGEAFTNGDEARVDALARVAGLMVRNARRYAVSERRREWVEASAEIAESLHDATRIDETLNLIVAGARRVSRAALVAVVRRTDGGLRGAGQLGRPVDHPARAARRVLRRDRHRPPDRRAPHLSVRHRRHRRDRPADLAADRPGRAARRSSSAAAAGCWPRTASCSAPTSRTPRSRSTAPRR